MYDIVLNVLGVGMAIQLLLFGFVLPKKHLAVWKFNRYYHATFAIVQIIGLATLASIDRLTFDLGFGLLCCTGLSVVLSLVAEREISLQINERFANN